MTQCRAPYLSSDSQMVFPRCSTRPLSDAAKSSICACSIVSGSPNIRNSRHYKVLGERWKHCVYCNWTACDTHTNTAVMSYANRWKWTPAGSPEGSRRKHHIPQSPQGCRAHGSMGSRIGQNCFSYYDPHLRQTHCQICWERRKTGTLYFII